MSNSKKENRNQQIQSFVRIRPLNNQEKDQRSHSIIDIPSNREVNVRQHAMSKKFTFDRVFGPKSTQIEVYSTVVSPLIQEVLAGYNCTVFAYGQTGTGKTYTMAGGSENKTTSWQNDPDAGIIPRTLSQLFDELRLLQVEHTVRVSYLELYNEELFDLLSPTDDSSKIRLYEDNVKKGSVIVHGLEEVIVHNKNEVYKILQRGSEKRQTASTLMNAQSSRSHTVFSITVHTKENTLEGEDLLKTGKLNLVDLAGSENIGRSGAVDKRAREAGNINQSLLTLGRVITALVERAPHVPYRESKLTRLLQDSLGGRTKTSIIATVSPAICNLDETLSTLEYAHRAKNITNRPEINQKFTKSALLKEYTEEIERLRRDLTAARSCNGIYLAPENYRNMIDDIENYARELTEKINEHRAVTEELEKANDICAQLNLQLTAAQAALMETEEKLKEVTIISEEEAHLVEKYSSTEQKLGQQARTLLNVVETVTKDTGKLHDKLDRVKNIESKNTEESEKFQNVFNSNLCQMQQEVEIFIQTQNSVTERFVKQNVDALNLNKNDVLATKKMFVDLLASLNVITSNMSSTIQHTVENDTKNADNLKHSMQTKFTDFLTVTTELLTNKISPLLECYVDNSNSKVEQIYDAQQKMFDQLVDTHQNFQTYCTNSQKRLEESLQHFTDLYKKNVESINHMTEAMKRKDERQKQLQALLELIQQDDDLIRSETNEIHATTKQMQLNFTECVKQEMDVGEQAVVASDTCLAEHKNKVRTISDDFVCKEKDFQHNCKDLQDNISEKLQEFKEIINTNIETTENQITSNLKENLDANRATCDFVSEINVHVSKLNTNIHNLESTVFQYQNESQEVHERNMDALTRQNNEFQEKITSEIRNRSVEVQKFLTEDIILQGSKPTGNTPARKDFIPYPRYLAATSPREVLLERFRKRRLGENSDKHEEQNSNEVTEVTTNVDDLRLLNNNEPKLGLVKSASANDLRSLNGTNGNYVMTTPKHQQTNRLTGKENSNSVPSATYKSSSTSRLVVPPERHVLRSTNN